MPKEKDYINSERKKEKSNLKSNENFKVGHLFSNYCILKKK